MYHLRSARARAHAPDHPRRAAGTRRSKAVASQTPAAARDRRGDRRRVPKGPEPTARTRDRSLVPSLCRYVDRPARPCTERQGQARSARGARRSGRNCRTPLSRSTASPATRASAGTASVRCRRFWSLPSALSRPRDDWQAVHLDGSVGRWPTQTVDARSTRRSTTQFVAIATYSVSCTPSEFAPGFRNAYWKYRPLRSTNPAS